MRAFTMNFKGKTLMSGFMYNTISLIVRTVELKIGARLFSKRVFFATNQNYQKSKPATHCRIRRKLSSNEFERTGF